MRRFSFRSPIKARPKPSAKQIAAKPLALFTRRASRTPSLDELASPESLPSESAVSETSGLYDNDEAEGEEEDERERLRRAKARAFSRAVEPVQPHHRDGHGGVDEAESKYSPREYDELAGDEDDDEQGESELTTDVAELQRQVIGLLLSRVAADDAWRQENERLRERLAAAESRETQLQERLQQLQERVKASATASDPAKPTLRERELLRLLVRIVGKEQIRMLLTPTSSSTQRTPAQLRRQLVTRASAASHRRPPTSTPPTASMPMPQAHTSPRKPKPVVTHAATPQPAVSLAATTPPTLMLSGTRKHEMSDAM